MYNCVMPHSVECIRYAQNPYSVYELIAITLCSAMYAIEATKEAASAASGNSTQGNTTLLHVITSIVLLI